MHPQLTQIIAELDAAQSRLHQLAAAVPEDRWARRADPNAWSVGECVAHLNITSGTFLPMLRAALADEGFRGVPAPARYHRDPAGWFVSIVAGPMLRIGGRRVGRVKTLASFVPSGDAPRATALAEFDRLQDAMRAVVRDSDGRPIHRMKVKSPFDPSGRLAYNVYSALVTIPRHQQRHLDQAEDVWASPRAS